MADDVVPRNSGPVRVLLRDKPNSGPRYDATPDNVASLAVAGSRRSSSTIPASVAPRPDPRTRNSFLIAAVAENRAREVGLCAIDLTAPYELLLWSLIDSQMYADTISLLHAYEPAEILVIESPKLRKVNDEIAKHFATGTCRVVPIARKYFDQTRGAEDLKRIIANTVDINLGRNYVVMAAVACLMKYIEYIQGVTIAEKTIKVILNPSMNNVLMDHATISSLELVSGRGVDSSSHSLCKMLNSTLTSAGYRLLRSTLLQPSCHLKTIRNRQEVISVFLENPSFFFDVKDMLKDFAYVDRLLIQLIAVPKVITPHTSRVAIGSVIALKHTLESLPKLSACLQLLESSIDERCHLLHSIIRSLQHDTFTGIRKEIERVINDRVKTSRSAAQKRIQECFAVRAGIDGMLDVARRTYLDTIEKIHEVVHDYKDEFQIPFRLIYTSKRGYHLSVPVNVTTLPSLFVERVPSVKGLSCSSRPLVSLNMRLNEALVAIYKLSNGVVQGLLQTVRPQASALYAMVDSIALLDMLLSFTNVVAIAPPDEPYVKPTVYEHGNMVIKKGRHPVVENAMNNQSYVPSDTFFDPLCSFHLITGPNCAGKSTYMRATAVITIMAQMGCYVPAAEARIPIRDRICTRFGTSDDMEENASSFSVEMTEVATILETCTSRSLVLVDELGRGTANDEGAAIAWSISEQLINRRCYTCHATHYHDLNRLEQLYLNCRCYHFPSALGERSIRECYKIRDGRNDTLGKYGIEAARACGIPKQITDNASETYERLCRSQVSEREQVQSVPNQQRPVNRSLLHHLYAIRYGGLSHSAIRLQLQHLREQYMVKPSSTNSHLDGCDEDELTANVQISDDLKQSHDRSNGLSSVHANSKQC